MGDRNHLHVCRHCGIVHATSSSTGPKKCLVCDGFVFSEYGPNRRLLAPHDTERRAVATDEGRSTRTRPLVRS